MTLTSAQLQPLSARNAASPTEVSVTTFSLHSGHSSQSSGRWLRESSQKGPAAIEPGKERALLVSVKTTEGLLKAHALARLDVTKSVRAVDLLAAAPRDRPHPHQALYGIPEGPVVGKLPANRELVDEDIHRRQPQPAKAFRSLSNWSKKPSGQESSAPSAFNVGVCTCGPSADRGEKK